MQTLVLHRGSFSSNSHVSDIARPMTAKATHETAALWISGLGGKNLSKFASIEVDFVCR
jgi:hypothetical protein